MTEREVYLIERYKQTRAKRKFKFSKNDWERCKEYFNNLCAYCALVNFVSRDHIDPTGSGELNNCVSACTTCNSSKGIKEMEEWYSQHKYFDKNRLDKIYKWIKHDWEDDNDKS